MREHRQPEAMRLNVGHGERVTHVAKARAEQLRVQLVLEPSWRERSLFYRAPAKGDVRNRWTPLVLRTVYRRIKGAKGVQKIRPVHQLVRRPVEYGTGHHGGVGI